MRVRGGLVWNAFVRILWPLGICPIFDLWPICAPLVKYYNSPLWPVRCTFWPAIRPKMPRSVQIFFCSNNQLISSLETWGFGFFNAPVQICHATSSLLIFALSSPSAREVKFTDFGTIPSNGHNFLEKWRIWANESSEGIRNIIPYSLDASFLHLTTRWPDYATFKKFFRIGLRLEMGFWPKWRIWEYFMSFRWYSRCNFFSVRGPIKVPRFWFSPDPKLFWLVGGCLTVNLVIYIKL